MIDLDKIRTEQNKAHVDETIADYDPIIREVIKQFPGNLKLNGTRYEPKVQ